MRILFLLVGISTPLFAFETAKVLPRGVRSLIIRNVNTTVQTKSNASGQLEPLAEPLHQDLTFKKMIANETGTRRPLVAAFLAEEGFGNHESAGTFQGDMRGNVHVLAPIFAYGILDNWTLGGAVPFFQSRMNVSMGFKASARGQAFVNRLHKPEYNLTEAAIEAGEKLNDAVGQLNDKLVKNRYQPLKSWSGSGMGDTTLVSKVRLLNRDRVQISNISGFTAPTGTPKSSDVLQAIPTGLGVWGVFTGWAVDGYLRKDLFVNQYAKYTYELPGKRNLRWATEEESIEVPIQDTRYKLGNVMETGVSLQYEAGFGLLAGVGYLYTQKAQDQYFVTDPQVKEKLESGTAQHAHMAEYRVGYSTVPAFQEKKFLAPFMASVEYKQVLASVNTPVQNLLSVDLMFFF